MGPLVWQKVLKPASGVVPGGTTAVHFDGTTTALVRAAALSGVVPGPVGMLSCWFHTTDVISFTAFPFLFMAPLNGSNLPNGLSSDFIQWSFFTNGGSEGAIAQLQDQIADNGVGYSDLNPPAYNDGLWHNAIYSWNTNFAIGAKTTQIAIDGVLKSVNIFNDFGIAFDSYYPFPGLCIGQLGFNGTNLAFLPAPVTDIAELYFNSTTALDLTVGANILKFRTVGGHPENLGTDGSVPTGTAPAVYLSVSALDAATQFAINRGTGGDSRW